ncbi:MAG: hypothetical protein HY531_01600, partial [Chloroflexi bacterium]|nr:hypothetical protein [Chloroflexota bacterium]
PYLDEMQHVNIKSEPAAQSAFITNKIDSMAGNPSPDNKPLFDKLLAEGKIQSLQYTVGGSSTGCRPQGIMLNASKPPFDNKKLRQAVNLAIDREGYTQVVHYGYAEPTLLLDTGGFGHTVAEIMKLPGWRQPHDQDLAEAKRIVAAEYSKGLDVEMLGRDTTTYMRQAEFFAGELRKVGINVTVKIMNSAQLFPAAEAGNYQSFSYYFCQTTGAPEELIGSYFITGGSRNWFGGYSNPKVDAGYLDMAGTLDPAERKRKAMALEALILEDLPMVATPVSTSAWNQWSYVQDWPVGITFYTNRKTERVWRSDA